MGREVKNTLQDRELLKTLENEQVVFEENSNLKIDKEVVKIITSLAAQEIDGVIGLTRGLPGSLRKILNKDAVTQGIKTRFDGASKVAINLYVILEYGFRVPDVAIAIQENVKKQVEEMTGLFVMEVNIHVQGIQKRAEDYR